MKRILLSLFMLGVMAGPSLAAETPAPYKGIHFSWEYGDYSLCSGFHIYKVGTAEALATITDRTKRAYFHPMTMQVGQSLCFTMDSFDTKGKPTERSKEMCVIVPLPGIDVFMVFPGQQ